MCKNIINRRLENVTGYKMGYSWRYADREISDFARFLDRADPGDPYELFEGCGVGIDRQIEDLPGRRIRRHRQRSRTRLSSARPAINSVEVTCIEYRPFYKAIVAESAGWTSPGDET